MESVIVRQIVLKRHKKLEIFITSFKLFKWNWWNIDQILDKKKDWFKSRTKIYFIYRNWFSIRISWIIMIINHRLNLIPHPQAYHCHHLDLNPHLQDNLPYNLHLIRSSQVSSKFGVYKFLVFSEILVHSFKPPILDYANREGQPCWVGWWCSRKTSAQLRARISLKTRNWIRIAWHIEQRNRLFDRICLYNVTSTNDQKKISPFLAMRITYYWFYTQFCLQFFT